MTPYMLHLAYSNFQTWTPLFWSFTSRLFLETVSSLLLLFEYYRAVVAILNISMAAATALASFFKELNRVPGDIYLKIALVSASSLALLANKEQFISGSHVFKAAFLAVLVSSSFCFYISIFLNPWVRSNLQLVYCHCCLPDLVPSSELFSGSSICCSPWLVLRLSLCCWRP